MRPRHEPAVPSPVSFVAARSRPGDDETLIRICAPSSASSWGVERCQKSSHTASPTPTPSRDGTARSMSPGAKNRRSSNRPYVGRWSLRWTWRTSPSSSRAAAMNTRWSADSSTNETTADGPPAVSAARLASRGSSRRIATSEARSWSRYPVSPSSGNTTRPAPPSRASASSSWWRARLTSRSPSLGATWARAMRSGCTLLSLGLVARVRRHDGVGLDREPDVRELAALGGVRRGVRRRDEQRRVVGHRAGRRGRDVDRHCGGRREPTGGERLGAATTGRLELLAGAVDLLGKVARDLVPRRQRPEQRDLRGALLRVPEALP